MNALLEQLTHDSVCLLKDMVSIPSASFGEEQVCSLISGFLDRCGTPHLREGNNLVIPSRKFDPEKKTLMLAAHIDTVPPCSGYSFDPYTPDYGSAMAAIPGASYSPAEGYNFICGLGSNDDGASVAAMTAAFRYLDGTDTGINTVLVLSAEEERSGKNGMEHIWKNFPGIIRKAVKASDTLHFRHPDWALVGEPTGMKAATSERGLLVVDATAEGVSGHAARCEGTNALYIAVDDIQRLRQHRFSKVSDTMGETILNVTQINAGKAHNIIPDRCTFTIDIRPTERYTGPELLDELQGICSSRLEARNLGNRSSATPAGSLLMECIAQEGIGTYSSPTTSDWMRIGCDAVKIGPGESSRSHRKDEFVYISEIQDAVQRYISIITRLSGLAAGNADRAAADI